ncbi:unnamed protein product [Strongylus vulgaris]|uniref:Uncharacterized protein n=1 Tax=Strongylus vulgaris TaxID=40348 RepID=A0A3P7K4G9_STRVU|nr:unnamed protein product [Strongylus vulgaris]
MTTKSCHSPYTPATRTAHAASYVDLDGIEFNGCNLHVMYDFLGFNVETVDYRNLSFAVWDAGGQQKIRPLWKYYLNSSKVIFTLVPLNV